jgi:cytochrome b subunit of formate dehydrogenase/5-methylcytosine-specific restriction endonuclease McrA
MLCLRRHIAIASNVELCCGILAALLAISASAPPVRAEEIPPEENACVLCHDSDNFEGETAHLRIALSDVSNDIHWQKKLQCHDCHGGDPRSTELREAHAADAGFRKVGGPLELSKFCGKCHSDLDYMRKTNPAVKVDYVAQFDSSVHGKFLQAKPGDKLAPTCSSCHPKHGIRAASDPKSSTNASQLIETCGKCHTQVKETLLTSVHGPAGKDGSKDGSKQPSCSDCHGKSVHSMPPVKDLASPVFAKSQTTLCGNCHEAALGAYAQSVHGKGLDKAGLLTSAVCASCHGSHGILRAKDPKSTLNTANVATTCAACHRFVEERLRKSVHGQGDGPGTVSSKPAPGGDVKRRASCTDCHVGHALQDPKSVAFRNQEPARCGNCHADLTSRYAQSMHGELTHLGYGPGAKCADCHGAHDILPVSNPVSTLSSVNRLETCRKCHPSANANLLTFDPHANHRDRAKSPVLYWIYTGLLIFICSVFSVFGIHSIVWFLRGLVDVAKHGRAKQLDPKEKAYIRFMPHHRIAHTVMVVSFLGLALTGLPLKFSDYEWGRQLASYLGGFSSTGLLHRLFSITMFGTFFSYIVLLLLYYRRGRKRGIRRIDVIWGPDSPLPGPRDLRDFIAMVRWFIGRGPRPTFERWAYWEKFDFWGACSDIILIGTSGLVLWFPSFFCQFLPGEAINVAKVLHSTLAMLATGFVFAIHFFGTHFRPDKFPMDMSVLTGLVSEEEMRHERPEYLERMRAEGKIEEIIAPGPSRGTLWTAWILGMIALTIGLGLLGGILYAAFR